MLKPVHEERETLVHRLLAAAIAVPVFEGSFLLVLCVLTGRWSSYFFLKIPPWVHVLYIGLAASVGLAFGFRGLTWLLGHLSLTHFDDQRDQRVTWALWAGVGLLLVVGYFSLSR